MSPAFFPTLNACLNGGAFLLLLGGWLAIKRGARETHKRFMVAALACSAAFLTSYLYYHFAIQLTKRYEGEGLLRGVYFFLLLTHTPLAALIVPFILAAVWFAYRGQFARHTRITRWLWPVWIYVSLTGVVIYIMLYIF